MFYQLIQDQLFVIAMTTTSLSYLVDYLICALFILQKYILGVMGKI